MSILAAALTWLGRLLNRKVAVKTQKTGKLRLQFCLPGVSEGNELESNTVLDNILCNVTCLMGHVPK